jgi:hypothetical protein
MNTSTSNVGQTSCPALEFGHFLVDAVGYLWPYRRIDRKFLRKTAVVRGKAALTRRAPKPVGISGACDERTSVLECGTPVPLCEGTGGCRDIGRFRVATIFIIPDIGHFSGRVVATSQPEAVQA